MLTFLADLSAYLSPLNVFRYITFRTGGATATAILFVFWFGPAIISTLLWANLLNPYVWVVLLVTVGFGAIGFYDDYLKVTKQSHKGFSGRSRLAIEAIIAVLACTAISYMATPGLANKLALPFSKELIFNLGWFYVIFAGFVIVGAGNAVNITDGLDGLAIVPVMIAAGTFGFIPHLSRNAGVSK